MPIVPPLLDDRSWQDLRDEALARVPIYTPEWTDLRPGDPGVALVEVFAYLTEALIYRLNRVPDNNYLAFLNLLDTAPRAGEPAKGIVQFALTDKNITTADIARATTLSAGAIKFTVADSLTVLPLELGCYVKVPFPGTVDATSDEGSFATAAFNAYKLAHSDTTVTAANFLTRSYPPTDGSSLTLANTVDGV